jgi:hypothetical protein
VVFDARGHFAEPHADTEIGLGTLEVRDYLAGIREHKVPEPALNVREARYPTRGPKNRFGAILFLEKEGFAPLLEEVRLAERYDLAIMSTKGMSVTAARELVQELCATHGIPLLVLHDFDISGSPFSERFATARAALPTAGSSRWSISACGSPTSRTSSARMSTSRRRARRPPRCGGTARPSGRSTSSSAASASS